jgi:hypothetical protein
MSLSTFSVKDTEGELILPIEGERFGDALFDFVQALAKVTDVSFLSRERVRSTFLEDFKAFFLGRYGPQRVTFDWNDPERDSRKKYTVDCRVNTAPVPLFAYALPNENRVKAATIDLMWFEIQKVRFKSVGIFEEQESINPKDVARFTDVVEKAFSNLDNRSQIVSYLDKVMPRKGGKKG